MIATAAPVPTGVGTTADVGSAADPAVTAAEAAVDVEAVTAADAALLSGALAGEGGAWAELVHRHDRYLRYIARALVGRDCDDLLQSAWLRLLERGDTIRDPGAVRAWLARVLLNEAKLVFRRRAWESTSSLDDAWAESIPSGDPTPEERVVVGTTATLVRRALHELPAKQHELMMLCAYADADYARISDILSMPIGSIGPTRGRALDRMRDRLITQGVDAAMRVAS